MPYSPRLALRVGERQSWVKCLVQEHNVAAAGSDGSSLSTQSHFTATPGDQAFEPPSGFESPTLSITSRARYRLSHRATTVPCVTRNKFGYFAFRSIIIPKFGSVTCPHSMSSCFNMLCELVLTSLARGFLRLNTAIKLRNPKKPQFSFYSNTTRSHKIRLYTEL